MVSRNWRNTHEFLSRETTERVGRNPLNFSEKTGLWDSLEYITKEIKNSFQERERIEQIAWSNFFFKEGRFNCSRAISWKNNLHMLLVHFHKNKVSKFPRIFHWVNFAIKKWFRRNKSGCRKKLKSFGFPRNHRSINTQKFIDFLRFEFYQFILTFS